MIRSLQKRHRWLWLCFSIVLPILFFFSLGGIIDQSSPTNPDLSKYELVYQDKLGINLTPSPIGKILRVEVLTPLTQPSPVLFYGDVFLGKLGPVGAYVFHLPKPLDTEEGQGIAKNPDVLSLRDGIKKDINEPINLPK